MTSNYLCVNNIFLAAILVWMICLPGNLNQFANEPYLHLPLIRIYLLTVKPLLIPIRNPHQMCREKITLPFDGQCSAGNGSFTFFNVDFRFSKFRELLLAETTNNKCLSFLFCYESSSEFVKPQYRIVNKNNNEIWNWNVCMENWHGFSIVFCLKDHETLELSISFSFIAEEMRKLIKFHSTTMNFFRIQFQTKNVRIFYQIDDDEKMEEINVTEYGDTEQQNFSLYNGNKMLQKNSHQWHVLLDITFSTADHFRIHRPKECVVVPKANSTNQTISIECKDVSCEFDISNEEQCGKRCRTKLTEKKHHHREALISHGQSISDGTKWPWLVAIEVNYSLTNDQGVKITEFPSKCSGAIIHPNFVLTAAHCLQVNLERHPWTNQIVKTKLLGMKIFAGHFDFNLAMQNIEEKPENAIFHENLDVALIKLSKQLKFSENIRSICLANFELKNEKIVHLAGWGLTQEMDYENATSGPIPEQINILQESKAKIIDNGICLSLAIEGIEKEQEIEKIEKEIKPCYCLQGLDNSHIQKGDSGGPMMSSVNGTWFTFGIANGGFLRESLKDPPYPCLKDLNF